MVLKNYPFKQILIQLQIGFNSNQLPTQMKTLLKRTFLFRLPCTKYDYTIKKIHNNYYMFDWPLCIKKLKPYCISLFKSKKRKTYQ